MEKPSDRRPWGVCLNLKRNVVVGGGEKKGISGRDKAEQKKKSIG